jgi:hypothetical protein
MPGKMAVLVAVSTSRLSCKRAGKTRALVPVWDFIRRISVLYRPLTLPVRLFCCWALGYFFVESRTPSLELKDSVAVDLALGRPCGLKGMPL